MFISSASKQKYALDEHPLRVRGTPEYNPLYDAVQSDFILPSRQQQQQQQQDFTNFQPIASSSARLMQNFSDDVESNYDKPRSYRPTNEQRPPSARQTRKVGENR